MSVQTATVITPANLTINNQSRRNEAPPAATEGLDGSSPLGVARGLANGLLISVPFWLVAIAAGWWLF